MDLTKIRISIDDGDELDVKVIEMLDRFKLQGLFYIPINSNGFQCVKRYKKHEVGGHTFSHPMDLKLLSKPELEAEISGAKVLLEDKAGHKVDSFCYPRGRYNDDVIEVVKKAGFTEARTTRNGMVMKNDRNPFKKPGFHCYQRREYDNEDWLDYITSMISMNLVHNAVSEINVWLHSWEIEKYNEWNKLKELFRYISDITRITK